MSSTRAGQGTGMRSSQVLIASPPKPVNEMTPDEVDAWLDRILDAMEEERGR